MTEDDHILAINVVLFDEKPFFLHNITSGLALSVRQDFNGYDCADQQRDSLEEIVLDSFLCLKWRLSLLLENYVWKLFLVYKTKTKFVAGKLCDK